MSRVRCCVSSVRAARRAVAAAIRRNLGGLQPCAVRITEKVVARNNPLVHARHVDLVRARRRPAWNRPASAAAWLPAGHSPPTARNATDARQSVVVLRHVINRIVLARVRLGNVNACAALARPLPVRLPVVCPSAVILVGVRAEPARGALTLFTRADDCLRCRFCEPARSFTLGAIDGGLSTRARTTAASWSRSPASDRQTPGRDAVARPVRCDRARFVRRNGSVWSGRPAGAVPAASC